MAKAASKKPESKLVKYPRTFNIPWSESNSSDDVWLYNCDHFENQEVVVTSKLDGECVDGQTFLETPEGAMSIQQICESQKGQKVLCYDESRNEAIFSDVVSRFIKDEPAEWFEIELEDGSLLKVTGNHLVWVPKLACYRRVDELSEGDEILVKN